MQRLVKTRFHGIEYANSTGIVGVVFSDWSVQKLYKAVLAGSESDFGGILDAVIKQRAIQDAAYWKELGSKKERQVSPVISQLSTKS
jgi:hypothetical protein